MSERLNEMIRAELEKRGLSERAASSRAGLSEGTLNYILKNADHTPAKETVKKLAAFFNWKEDLVLEVAGYKTEAGTPVAPPSPRELLERLQTEMPAAIPSFDQLLHANSGAVPMGYVYLPAAEARGKRLVAAPVRGDCMLPTLNDGDLVIVDLDGSPNHGDVVVVLVDSEDVQLRRFVRRLNSHIVCSCDNPAYPDVELEDVRIQGVVIQATKRLRG